MACPHTTGADCPLCSATLDGDSAGDTLVRGEVQLAADQLQPGAHIGRYLVTDRLGQGGMGVVYTAHDPQLERVVAIKVLRSSGEKSRSETAGQTRLLREAQAMAQLAHPNVVQVYDSGPFGDGVFIAMELVRGSTLDHWMKVKPRAWREVVSLFIDAGRGLEAAHRKGLIHRDFKPANVLVGEDGRPRVTDFGLARALTNSRPPEQEDEPTLPNPISRSGPISLETPLTQAGAMMGSPGYMAPEQYAGAETSAATDQFSFCVSLYEALYGVRPFVAKSIPELELVTARGVVPPPPKGSTVPPWLHRIVVKGLAPDPAARHASMTVLLAALADDPAVRRRRVGWLIAGAVALAAVIGGVAWSTTTRTRACQGADALLDGVWDGPVKARSEAAFLATGLPYARASWLLTRDALDTWARAWVDARTEACEATRVRKENTERQLLLRVECLDRRLNELGALAEAFGAADRELVASSGTAAARLSPIASCANIKQLEDRRAPPAELAAQAKELAQQISSSRAQLLAGRHVDARMRLSVAATRAAELKLPALESEAREALGDLELNVRDFMAARRAYELALRAAEVAGDDAAAARIVSHLVSLVGWRLERPDEARTWAALAAGITERIGGDPLTEARIEEGLGDTEWQDGKRAQALAAYRKSLAMYVKAGGEETLDVARLRSSAGWVLTEQGELKAAREELERSRAIREHLLGSGHPTLADTWNELASLATEQRDDAEAVRCTKLMLALVEQSGSPIRTIQVRASMANAEVFLDPAAALAELEGVRPLMEKTEVIQASWTEFHRVHVQALTLLGRSKEALTEGRVWLAEDERRLGKTHPDVASLANALSMAAFAQGLWAEAIEGAERYLAMKAALGGADSPRTGVTLLRSAQAHLASKRAVEATPRAERALTALEQGPLDRALRGEARRTLAEALLALKQQPERAELLLQQAKEDAQASGDIALLARIAKLQR